MGEVTTAELQELRREVQETKWLVYGVLGKLVGKKKADETLGEIQLFLERRRYDQGTPVYKVAGANWYHLIEADLLTLEEVATKPRREVAAITGVGRVTMRHIEDAMADHGLTWAEVA